jgi:segregation and condensation protein B
MKNHVKISEKFALKIIEALLFSSSQPLSSKIIKGKLAYDADIERLMDMIKEKHKDSGFQLYKIQDAWAFRTTPDVVDFLVVEKKIKKRLSKAALEILAIIAYHQPITRAEIEDIRGVSVGQGSIQMLFESSWIEPRGHRNVPGRPSTWRTTKHFLDHFGLESIKDLPDVSELKALGLLSRNVSPSVIKKN